MQYSSNTYLNRIKSSIINHRQSSFWAIILGWIFGMCSLVPIPLIMVISITNNDGSFLQRVKKLTSPEKSWGPALQEDRKNYVTSCELTSLP